ncbi:MAG: hypothetical protein CVU17_09970 [Betaproteobacteria bacterium HGW-Betaproteobacteria-11]|nr:MAG: hypothetical protein CVU17_09970 [Betaproteobacteria bacterium HGW-Betaproteobacteria-11]
MEQPKTKYQSDDNENSGLETKGILLHEEGDFRVYAEDIGIMWKWDLYQGERHLHTGCAQRPESCVVSAKTRISFFQRKDVAGLMTQIKG